MDDFRRPQQPQRRDYTSPQHHRRPDGQSSHPAQPAHQPHQPSQPAHHQPPQPYQPPQPPQDQPELPAQNQPTHHYSHSQHHQHQPQPTYQPAPNYQPAHQQPHRSPSEIARSTQPHKPEKVKKSPVLKIITIFVVLITAAALIYFGYSLKSSTSGNGIPEKIVQQAGFTVYFPSPMPPGYTYMKDTATFDIGQVFFKFSSGDKRVTVNEQPLPAKLPKMDVSQSQQYDSPIGKVTIGTNFGVVEAQVVAGQTLISLNTSGGVTQDELKTAINNMKNIGLSTDKKQ